MIFYYKEINIFVNQTKLEPNLAIIIFNNEFLYNMNFLLPTTLRI